MRRVLLLLAMMAMGMLVAAPPALAQTTGPSGADGTYNCEDFTDQGQAQEFYNNDPGDTNGLDEDGDGTACESLPTATQEDPCPDPNFPRETPDGCQASALSDVASEPYQYEAAPAEQPATQYQYEPVATEAPPEGATPLPVSGGISPLLFVGSALAAFGLIGFGLLRRG